MNLNKLTTSFRTTVFRLPSRVMSNGTGQWGSGSGKGGGSGGSIRDAGGSFGRQEAAREEEYFRRKQAEQLNKLKSHLSEEIDRNEALIKQHAEAIETAKKKIQELEEMKKDN